MITCAVTGSADTTRKNGNVPVTPREIARDVIAAAEAGACIAHIHVRDPESKLESRDPALFDEVVSRVRESGTDILLNLTTAIGTRVMFDDATPMRLSPVTDFLLPEERTRHVARNRPQLCSLDLCTMMYGDEPYINLPNHIRSIAETARHHGVKPEIEIFNPGDLVLLKEMIGDRLFVEPLVVQFVLGVRYGAPATARSLLALLDELPPRSVWTAFATGVNALPMAAQSILLGGHVRVGLEDNLWVAKNVPATNAALVEQAVRLVESVGERPATAQEARLILGIGPVASGG